MSGGPIRRASQALQLSLHSLPKISVARAGKGYSQFVTDEERMDKKVIGMIKNAIKNALTDFKDETTSIIPIHVKPKNAITLSAQSLDGPIKLKVDPVTLQNRKHLPWLLGFGK
ncbi:3753_t:CDS:2 [Ambispora leptoticha]|uniref:3753_t:CDS:1 n=1 Tax=Ambispora leptoticha TaxID=144679 RepID=A0A9N9A4N2_9GLOM|nr:3753_t:CDS:2 [Ambispora leptoticha]